MSDVAGIPLKLSFVFPSRPKNARCCGEGINLAPEALGVSLAFFVMAKERTLSFRSQVRTFAILALD